MANKNPIRNASGYMDLTAFYAIRNADRKYAKERKQSVRVYKAPKPKVKKPKQEKYPRIYICSPFSGDIKRNRANAARFSRHALEMGCFPIAPHLYLPRFMNDADPSERELALSFGLRLLSGCKEVWVFGENISAGMKGEIAEAKRRRITVRYFNESYEETQKGNA